METSDFSVLVKSNFKFQDFMVAILIFLLNMCLLWPDIVTIDEHIFVVFQWCGYPWDENGEVLWFRIWTVSYSSRAHLWKLCLWLLELCGVSLDPCYNLWIPWQVIQIVLQKVFKKLAIIGTLEILVIHKVLGSLCFTKNIDQNLLCILLNKNNNTPYILYYVYWLF